MNKYISFVLDRFFIIYLFIGIASLALFTYQDRVNGRIGVSVYVPYLDAQQAGEMLEREFKENLGQVTFVARDCYRLYLIQNSQSELNIRNSRNAELQIKAKVRNGIFNEMEKSKAMTLRDIDNFFSKPMEFDSRHCLFAIDNPFENRWIGLIVVFLFNLILSKIVHSGWMLIRTHNKYCEECPQKR